MSKVFTFEYRVRLDDLDYMGIVGNARWLTLLERARADLLTAIDYPMTRFFSEKIGAVVADLTIKYIRPARMDDTVSIEISVEELADVFGNLHYVASSKSGQPFVKAQTKMVFVDEAGRPTKVPEEIRASLI